MPTRKTVSHIDGDGDSVSPLLPLIPPLPSSYAHAVEDALSQIKQDEKDTFDNRGYVSRIFTQVCLPYRDPLKINPSLAAWERRNGSLTLLVEPAVFENKKKQLVRVIPYGKYPRLFLPWLTTQIVKTVNAGGRRADGTVEVEFTSSLPQLLNELGQSWGGRQGSRILDQFKAVFGARFLIHEQQVNDAGRGERGASYQIAKAYQLWFGNDGALSQDGLWGNSLVVSSDFAQDVLDCPIPIDLRAVTRLSKHGSMAMDIYTWLNYRLPAAKRSSVVPWAALAFQLGTQNKLLRKFKRDFITRLPAVLAEYPAAKVKVTDKGLQIFPSRPATPFIGLSS